MGNEGFNDFVDGVTETANSICKDDGMLDLQIFGIREVLDMEEIFHLLHTLCCQIDDLVLLIYNEKKWTISSSSI